MYMYIASATPDGQNRQAEESTNRKPRRHWQGQTERELQELEPVYEPALPEVSRRRENDAADAREPETLMSLAA